LLPGSENPDEAIHAARRSLKKIRSILKLLRPLLGDRYQDENSRFGDIGRQLSPFRDAAALIETLDELHEKHKDQASPAAFRGVRAALVSLKTEIDARSDRTAAIRRTLDKLTPGRAWPLGSNGPDALAPGLESTWRKGRKALRKVSAKRRPENFHALRRNTKTLRFQMSLIGTFQIAPQERGARWYETLFKDLDKWLGEAHNLTLLAGRIAEDPAHFGSAADLEAIGRIISKRQQKLEAQSLELAKRVYDEKARTVTRRLLSA
jgi:CHAD domain-containing protein